MTDPAPNPTPEPEPEVDQATARRNAQNKMLAAVPDAIKALRELAATAENAEVRLKAAEMLLSYGIPVMKGGTRGDIL